MRLLVAVGIVLVLSGPLLIGWAYSVNPSDFSSNVVVPVFDAIVLGLIILGFVSILLSRVPISPLRVKAIAVAFLLVPVAVFVVGNLTTETACFGSCNQNNLYAYSASCAGTSGVTCLVGIIATESVFPSVTGATIAFGNMTTTGQCGVYGIPSGQSESLRCEFPVASQTTGTPFAVSVSFSEGETWNIQGNLTSSVQAAPYGVSLVTTNCNVSANITCGFLIGNQGNASSTLYKAQELSYTVENPGACEPAGCQAFTSLSTIGTCNPTFIGAQSAELVICTFQLLQAPAGGGYFGSLLFTNGAELTFGGNWTS